MSKAQLTPVALSDNELALIDVFVYESLPENEDDDLTTDLIRLFADYYNEDDTNVLGLIASVTHALAAIMAEHANNIKFNDRQAQLAACAAGAYLQRLSRLTFTDAHELKGTCTSSNAMN